MSDVPVEKNASIYETLDSAQSKLLRVSNLIELMFLAGEGLSQPAKNAFTAGADTINEILCEATELVIDAQRVARGGAL